MRSIRIGGYIGLFVTSAFYGSLTIPIFLFATPKPDQTWVEGQNTSTTRHLVATVVPMSVGGLIIDLFALLLPLVAVSRLQLAYHRKIGVILVFMAGLMQVSWPLSMRGPIADFFQGLASLLP